MTERQSKECFECNEVKPMSLFTTNHRMKDGKLNKCKLCIKKEKSDRLINGSKEKLIFRDGMKLCIACNKTSKHRSRIGVWHPVEDFSKCNHTAGGYSSSCKNCKSGKTRVETVTAKESNNSNSLVFILNQATKNLTSTSKGYYTYD